MAGVPTWAGPAPRNHLPGTHRAALPGQRQARALARPTALGLNESGAPPRTPRLQSGSRALQPTRQLIGMLTEEVHPPAISANRARGPQATDPARFAKSAKER